MREIVVGVDGSTGSTAALQWAAHEAAIHGGKVTAVLAWGFLDQHHPDSLLREHTEPHQHEDAARAALDAAVAIALGLDAARHVRREVACDLAVPVLVGRSKAADLLVVGARGLDGFRSLLLGSVSDGCVRHATCPVAVVQPTIANGRMAVLAEQRSGDVAERVVVGVDGSRAARLALRWALREARLRHARLDLVHAWQLPFVTGMAGLQLAGVLEDAAREILEGALDDVQDRDTEGITSIHELLFCSAPGAAIVETAQGADLVVLGTRRAPGAQPLIAGSVSRQVVQHAPCPVVVVPGDGGLDGPDEPGHRAGAGELEPDEPREASRG